MPHLNLKPCFKLIICLSLIQGCSSNIELRWNQEKEYSWAEVSPGFWGGPGFKKLSSSQTGIQFENFVSEESIAGNRNYLNGSGVAAGDVDGDGLTDLYFARLKGPNKLYRNEGGFRFTDITEQAGVALEESNSTGVAFADVDGDGDNDLLTASFDGPNVLYLNDGTGAFTLKEDSGLEFGYGSTTMALADVDGDGDLDLYVTNYKEKSIRDMYGPRELSLNRTVKVAGDSYELIPPFDKHYGIIRTEDGQIYRNEYGEPDQLYINDGEGRFSLADPNKHFFSADGEPVGLERDWGLAAKFHDFNGDGFPDLYVCNDFWTPDRVWVNRGDGTFRSTDSHEIRNFSFSSMGVDFSDIDRDGSTDIFVTEMLSQVHQRRMRQLSDHLEGMDGRPQYNRNSLYLNRGDNTFAEISYYSGLQATEWSWVARFLDVDLDGYEDLLITTGHGYDYQDLDTQIRMEERTNRLQQVSSGILEYPSLELPNKAFQNNGDLSFTDQSEAWGFTGIDVSHGMAVADLDNDGDLDIIINRLNKPAAVYQNTATAPRIAVRLEGKAPNTGAVGAVVELSGGPVIQTKEIAEAGDYLSDSDPMISFAADPGNSNHRLKVIWPDGNQTRFDSVKSNRIYKIDQTAVVISDTSVQRSAASLKLPTGRDESALRRTFKDVSEHIDHSHHENDYNDFKVRPLLPFKLSQQGPGVAWIDFDRDGNDDLFIATGKDGQAAVYENLGGGQLKPYSLDGLTDPSPGDQTTILGWAENDRTIIIAGSANYEQGNPNVPSALYYSIGQDQSIEVTGLPGILSTTGPLAAADYDGDGDIDLFIGGRFVPGRYPQDADSRLFKNENGRFVLDEINSPKLRELGLVTGAVFTDYDGDGDQDLLLSLEWGTLRLYQNDQGSFTDVTETTGLSEYSGWWNGIATGDFNNDSRPDIIATNLGLNSPYQLDGGYPLRMYYDDLNGDGRLDIVEAYYDLVAGSYVPRRRLYEFDSMPTLLQSVTSHKEFAGSSLDNIFNRDFDNIPYKSINTLQHMVFINTDKGFTSHPLPGSAQFSAAFAAVVADFDNDGNEDIFLSQNTFAGRIKEPRLDGGRGLWLKGDGKGDFVAIPGQESGIKIYGQQRGAALSDFNRDGRVDLVVTQNDAATKLYKNQTERQGLRIRLAGPPTNQTAIGAGIRLIYESGEKGPRREIQAGSGYWSQNSSTQVLGMENEPVAIEVSWPDGTVQEVDISRGKSEYLISY